MGNVLDLDTPEWRISLAKSGWFHLYHPNNSDLIRRKWGFELWCQKANTNQGLHPEKCRVTEQQWEVQSANQHWNTGNTYEVMIIWTCLYCMRYVHDIICTTWYYMNHALHDLRGDKPLWSFGLVVNTPPENPGRIIYSNQPQISGSNHLYLDLIVTCFSIFLWEEPSFWDGQRYRPTMGGSNGQTIGTCPGGRGRQLEVWRSWGLRVIFAGGSSGLQSLSRMFRYGFPKKAALKCHLLFGYQSPLTFWGSSDCSVGAPIVAAWPPSNPR